jgi:hypothetical protein
VFPINYAICVATVAAWIVVHFPNVSNMFTEVMFQGSAEHEGVCSSLFKRPLVRFSNEVGLIQFLDNNPMLILFKVI